MVAIGKPSGSHLPAGWVNKMETGTGGYLKQRRNSNGESLLWSDNKSNHAISASSRLKSGQALYQVFKFSLGNDAILLFRMKSVSALEDDQWKEDF